MMKDHRLSRYRSLGGAAALTVLAGLGISLAAPGIAHPHPDGEGKQQQRIVIMEHKGGAAPREGVRSFRIERGENGEPVLPEGCRNSEPLANVDERSGDRRTRIVLCGAGEGTAASRLEHLQRARERIASSDEFTGEHRDRVIAAIDREIARLRGAQ